MTTNWEDRDRDRYRRAHSDYESRNRGRDERDFTDRAGDEMRSWFGDDDAERRRRMDERSDRYGERSYGEGGYGRYQAGQDDRDFGGSGNYGRYSGYGSGGAGGYGGGSRYYGGFSGASGRSFGAGTYGAGTYGGRSYGEDFGPGRAGSMGRTRYGGSADYGSRDRHESEDRGFFERAGDEIASWFGDDEAERRRRMDRHSGRGPKGYTRSDERIREDVNDRLTDDPHIDASNIEVTVSSGEVTLSGSVTERFAKRHAEDIAERVSGVRHVQNNVRVVERSSSSGEQYSGAFAETARMTAESKTGRTRN